MPCFDFATKLVNAARRFEIKTRQDIDFTFQTKLCICRNTNKSGFESVQKEIRHYVDE